jgi:uncharacterized repeat protein (TIGR01451 family)
MSSVALIFVVIPASGRGSSTSEQPPAPKLCSAGMAYGIIAGVPTCLARGLPCTKRYDNDEYHRYGFHCHGRWLTERRPRLRRADLSLTTFDSPDPVPVGAEVTYSLTVGNHGPGPARDIYLLDALWPSTRLVRSTSSQGSCYGMGARSDEGLVCALGNIRAGEAVRVTIVGRVLARPSGFPTRNYGFAESARVDPYFRNNVALVTTSVVG